MAARRPGTARAVTLAAAAVVVLAGLCGRDAAAQRAAAPRGLVRELRRACSPDAAPVYRSPLETVRELPAGRRDVATEVELLRQLLVRMHAGDPRRIEVLYRLASDARELLDAPTAELDARQSAQDAHARDVARARRIDELVAWLDAAVRDGATSPRADELRALLVDALLLADDTDRAAREAAALRARSGESRWPAAADLWLAQHAFDHGDLAAARTRFAALVARGPSPAPRAYASALFHLAWSERRLGNARAAREAFAALVALARAEPNDVFLAPLARSAEVDICGP